MRGIAIACLSLFAFAGCAFDESAELPGDGEMAMADDLADQDLEGASLPSESTALAGEVELTREPIENARPGVSSEDAAAAGEAKDEEASLGPDAQRIMYGGNGCHTHGWLADRAIATCRQLGWNSAGAFHYTNACRGWWGAGAEKLWVTCYNN